MARITPQSKIWLHRGVITSRPIVFSTALKRDSYFQSKRVTFSGGSNNFTVVRDGSVKIEAPLELVDECDFISFQNLPFDSRVYYASITGRRYVNNECTQITYEVNNWYTYMFDVNLSKCIIDRETISKDKADKARKNPYDESVYELTTPEPLPSGKDIEPYYYEVGDFSPSSPGYNRDASRLMGGVLPSLRGVGGIRPCLFVSPCDTGTIDDVLPTSKEFASWYNNTVWDFVQNKGFIQGFSNVLTDYREDPPRQIGEVGLNTLYYNGGDASIQTQINTSFSNSCDIFIGDNIADIQNVVKGLTKYNATSAIVACYAIPEVILFLLGSWQNPNAGFFKPSMDLSDNDPKLYRSPFSYLRITSPNNDVKELYYERFKDLIEKGPIEGEASLHVQADLMGSPAVHVFPEGYMMNPSDEDNDNTLERITFSGFAQVPLSIDGYAAYYAAAAAKKMQGNTGSAAVAEKSVILGAVLQYGAAIFSGINSGTTTSQAVEYGSWKNSGSGITISRPKAGTVNQTRWVDYDPDFGNASSAGMGASALAASEAAFDLAIKHELKNGSYDSSSLTAELHNTRGAFVSDIYRPGSVDGTDYYLETAAKDFVVQNIHPRSEVIQIYNHYFENFGYASGRFDHPCVVKFLMGLGEDSSPDWKTVDNLKIAYCKTSNIKAITAPRIEVAAAFEEIFNNGAQFVNGDVLQ